jgi:hypothetical protein
MSIAIVTSMFNCVAGSVRHRHYETFVRTAGLPVYTVELAFDDLPFVLPPADRLFQLRSDTWVWQRDRIVNRLLEEVPREYDNIALIDADILFHDPDWPRKTEQMLERCPVGQVWANCHHTYAGVPPDRGVSNRDVGTVHTGYGWAMRREFLDRFGLFDRSPVGGNDVFMTFAYFGWTQHNYLRHYTPQFLDYYRRWAEPVTKATGGETGYVEADITHMWHGAKAARNYIGRLELLKDFDPDTDLAVDASGCWAWATDKPDLHAGVKAYMQSRTAG